MELLFQNDNSHLPEECSTLARQRWWKDVRNTMGDANFWFRPLTAADEAFYCSLHRETWTGLYGAESGYDAGAFFRDALEWAGRDARAVSVAMLREEAAGVVQLDLARDEAQGAGHIRFLALAPGRRGKGLAPQLLGQAVSIYRGMGRDRLRLLCAPKNERARRFYDRHGFRTIAAQPGHRGSLDQMEKYICYRPDARGGLLLRGPF